MSQRKKQVLFICILSFLLITLVGCGNEKTVSTTVEYDDTEMKVESITIEKGDLSAVITYGIKGVIAGSVFPVEVNITNTGKKFEGTAAISIPDYDGKKGIAYEKNIVVEEGSTKKVNFSISTSGEIPIFKVALNQNGSEILGKEIELEEPYIGGVRGILVGVLSEKPDSLDYFNNSIVEDVNEQSALTVAFDTESFPTEKQTLDALSFLIIDQFNTKRLSKAQRNVIKEWVNDGGVLILGTGTYSEQVLSGFGSDYLEYSIEGTERAKVKYIQGSSDQVITVDNTYLKMGYSNTLEDIVEGIQIGRIEKGKGNIIVVSCMLGNKSFQSWKVKQEFASTLLNRTVSEEIKEQLIEQSDLNSNYYLLEDALSFYDGMNFPKIEIYIIVFTIYILTIGPIGYFILKKKDKREKIWILIPITTFVFYFVIIGLNQKTEIKQPIGTTLTIVDSTSTNWKSNIYMSFINSSKKGYQVSVDKMYQPVQSANLAFYLGEEEKYHLDTTRYSINNGEDETIISFGNTEAFSKNIFAMYSEQEEKASGFEKNISMSDNKISGTVTNQTGYDLSEAGIVYNGFYMYLGNVKAGETVSLDSKKTKMLLNTTYTNMGDLLIKHMPSNTREARTKRNQFNQIYQIVGHLFERMKTGEGYVFGIANNYDKDYIKNSEVQESGVALFYDFFEQLPEDVGEYYVQNILEVMTDSKRNNIFIKENSLNDIIDEVEFQFDSNYEVVTLRSSGVTSEERYQDRGLSISAWNYKKKRYEPIFQKEDEISGTELQAYISNHRMKLKFESNSGYSMLPIISAIGGESDVGN